MRQLNPFATGSRGRNAYRVRYATYMKSEAWFARRQWWFATVTQSGTIRVECLGCSKNWCLERDDLHHIDYTRLGSEKVEDLWPLCRSCHSMIHDVMDSSKTWRKIPRRHANSLALNIVIHVNADPGPHLAKQTLRDWL